MMQRNADDPSEKEYRCGICHQIYESEIVTEENGTSWDDYQRNVIYQEHGDEQEWVDQEPIHLIDMPTPPPKYHFCSACFNTHIKPLFK